MANTEPRVCPECNHEFQGNGWDGIDAHWKARYGHIMRYEDAWPLIQSGSYAHQTKKRQPREDFSQAADGIVKEAAERH